MQGGTHPWPVLGPDRAQRRAGPKGLTATVRSLKAGEVKEFTEVVDRARHTALERLIDHARQLGGNAAPGAVRLLGPRQRLGRDRRLRHRCHRPASLNPAPRAGRRSTNAAAIRLPFQEAGQESASSHAWLRGHEGRRSLELL